MLILTKIFKRKPALKSKATRKRLEYLGISPDEYSVSSSSINKRELLDQSSSNKQTNPTDDTIIREENDNSKIDIKAQEALKELDNLQQSILEYKGYLEATNRFIPTEKEICERKDFNTLKNGISCLNQPLTKSRFDEPYPKYLNPVKSPKKLFLSELKNIKLKNFQMNSILETSKKQSHQSNS
jgi:hypothetical protein